MENEKKMTNKQLKALLLSLLENVRKARTTKGVIKLLEKMIESL